MYGYREQTSFSLLLLILPSKLKTFNRINLNIDEKLFLEDKKMFFHTTLVMALEMIGIDIIQVSEKFTYPYFSRWSIEL